MLKKILTINDIDKIENLRLNYNSIYCPENIKAYLQQIAEKNSGYTPSTIKPKIINEIINMLNLNAEIIVYSDYKENESHNINIINSTVITIIFNVNNFERLLLVDASRIFVLIDLSNFTHDFNIIAKYISAYNILIDPYYIIFSKVWINFSTSSLIKNSFIEYIPYNPNLYKCLNRISFLINCLYVIINKYISNESIGKKVKLKRIMTDKDINNILKIINTINIKD